MESLKFSKKIKRMGKNLDLLHDVGSSHFLVAFEHTQNESSDLSSFLGVGLAMSEPFSVIFI